MADQLRLFAETMARVQAHGVPSPNPLIQMPHPPIGMLTFRQPNG
jgi:hypothetical protein